MVKNGKYKKEYFQLVSSYHASYTHSQHIIHHNPKKLFKFMVFGIGTLYVVMVT